MLDKITHDDFIGWLAYSEIDPWGDQREDWRNAYLVSTLVNLQRKPGSLAKPIKDFLLEFDTKPVNDWKTNKANLLQHLFVADELMKKEAERGN